MFLQEGNRECFASCQRSNIPVINVLLNTFNVFSSTISKGCLFSAWKFLCSLFYFVYQNNTSSRWKFFLSMKTFSHIEKPFKIMFKCDFLTVARFLLSSLVFQQLIFCQDTVWCVSYGFQFNNMWNLLRILCFSKEKRNAGALLSWWHSHIKDI